MSSDGFNHICFEVHGVLTKNGGRDAGKVWMPKVQEAVTEILRDRGQGEQMQFRDANYWTPPTPVLNRQIFNYAYARNLLGVVKDFPPDKQWKCHFFVHSNGADVARKLLPWLFNMRPRCRVGTVFMVSPATPAVPRMEESFYAEKLIALWSPEDDALKAAELEDLCGLGYAGKSGKTLGRRGWLWTGGYDQFISIRHDGGHSTPLYDAHLHNTANLFVTEVFGPMKGS